MGKACLAPTARQLFASLVNSAEANSPNSRTRSAQQASRNAAEVVASAVASWMTCVSLRVASPSYRPQPRAAK